MDDIAIVINGIIQLYPIFYDVLAWKRYASPRNITPQNRIDNVKHLLDYLIATFQSAFYPGYDISVDEIMIGCKRAGQFPSISFHETNQVETKSFCFD